jgi:hypothetical protein
MSCIPSPQSILAVLVVTPHAAVTHLMSCSRSCIFFFHVYFTVRDNAGYHFADTITDDLGVDHGEINFYYLCAMPPCQLSVQRLTHRSMSVQRLTHGSTWRLPHARRRAS